MIDRKKASSALTPNETPAPGIDSITKIRDADFNKTYDRLVTDKGTVVVAKEGNVCAGCLFDHDDDGCEPRLDGHACDHMPICDGVFRTDKRNVIWVKEASNAAA